LATDSALKLVASGRSTGEIAARRDNKKQQPDQGKVATAITMRRIIAPYLNGASLR
jgi:hypothetical protein